MLELALTLLLGTLTVFVLAMLHFPDVMKKVTINICEFVITYLTIL